MEHRARPPVAPAEIYALLHRWKDVCVISHVLKSAGIQGWHRPAEAVGLSPGAAPPPFFSLISTRQGSPISRKKVLFFSYSSSSITLTDIVLLKQRRIEIDEQGEEAREEKEHREEESKVNLSCFPDKWQLRNFCTVNLFFQNGYRIGMKDWRACPVHSSLPKATELFQAKYSTQY